MELSEANFAIELEQSQVCLRNAEHEQNLRSEIADFH